MDRVIKGAIGALSVLCLTFAVAATFIANKKTEEAAALTATLHLANNIADVSGSPGAITVCVSGVTGLPRIIKGFEDCDKDEETVLFPVHYRPNGSSIIGQPHVGNDIEWYEVAAK